MRTFASPWQSRAIGVALCTMLFLGVGSQLSRAQSFTEVTTDGWGPGIDQPAPCILDIDGDGLVDILVGTSQQSIWHFEQSSPRSLEFTLRTRSFAGFTGEYEPHVTAGDLDGDGRIDLLIGGNDGKLIHYEQDEVRGSTFARVNDAFSGIDIGNHAMPQLCDLEQDGLFDLIIGSSHGNFSHYRQPAAHSLDFVPGTPEMFPNTGAYMSTYLTDINGDGLLDALQTKTDGMLRHSIQSAVKKDSFTVATTPLSTLRIGDHVMLAAKDLDGDGRLELIAGTGVGRLLLFRQSAADSYEFGSPIDSTFLRIRDFGAQASIAVADIDGNGRLDILVGAFVQQEDLQARVLRLEQAAAGSLAFDVVADPFSGISCGEWPGLGLHDIDGNGRLDLLIGDNFARFKRYEQREVRGTTFSLVNPLFNRGMDMPGNASYPAFIDLDGNGRLDMLVANSNRSIHHYEQDAAGDTTFTIVNPSFNGGGGSYYPYVSFSRDPVSRRQLMFVGVGMKVELFAQDSLQPRVFTRIGTVPGVASLSYAQPAAADVNADGITDLLVGHQDGGISLYLGSAVSACDETPSALLCAMDPVFPQPATAGFHAPVRMLHRGTVLIDVADATGRCVAVLFDGTLEAGTHLLRADAGALPSGVYVVRVHAAGVYTVRALTILH